MPTFTNYNNYIKAKANSAICCVTTGNCVDGGTSGGTSGTGTADFSKLTNADENIVINYTPSPGPSGATSVSIGLSSDIFAHHLTLSNESLTFKDASGHQLTLGYHAPLDQSYSLYFPQKAPSLLTPDTSGYALVTDLCGNLTWFRPSLNTIDASLQYLYENLTNAAGIKIRDVVQYATYNQISDNDLSFNTDNSSLTFHHWNFATTISYEKISNNGDIKEGTRFLINGQTDNRQNGIYKISSFTSGVSFELVRTSDMQPDTPANNIYVFAEKTGQGWLQNEGPVSVGEGSLNFIKFSDFEAELTDIVAGKNIDVSENGPEFTISLKDDISLSSIDISKSLTLSDASLVFQTKDNSINIVAPQDLSHSYNLSLPKTKADVSGSMLKVDNSGQLYFSNLLDLSLDKLSNLDLSHNGTEYILKLLQDISITSLDVSSSITFKSSNTDKRIKLQAPKSLDASYTLTLPDTLVNISGGFLRSTLSGDLYFSNAWLNTISGDHNIDISIITTQENPHTKISLNPDISVSTIDVSSSINLIDASLVFHAKDSSAITIVAPSGISNEYTLTLPISHTPDQSGNFLKVDGSGQLYFADASLNDLSGTKNIDISYGTNYNFISLKEDISLTNIELSGNLTFSIGDNSNVTIGIPQDVSSYTLTLPISHTIDQSGNFLRVDGSGQLYFADASLGDLSGSTNIDISYGTNYNFINLAKDIKDISSIALDSSLVFNISDTSSITIIPPTDISNSYSLTLPSDLKAGLLRSDKNGILSFVDASLSDLSGSINIDISNRGGFNIISLKSDLQDISSIALDSSLVFQLSDGSAITIVAPTDASGYTLKLPKNYKEVTESSGQFLRVDGSGQLYFADASLDIISIEAGNSNLTISSEKIGDTNTFTIDLCSNLDLSSITLDKNLTFKDDGKIVFEGTDSANAVTIDISKSGLDRGYNLQLPIRDPSYVINKNPNYSYDNKAIITVDENGIMEFNNLQRILENTSAGINAREAVRYATNPEVNGTDTSNSLHSFGTDISYLLFTRGINKIGDISNVSDFSKNDRILINAQINSRENGIYRIDQVTTDISFTLVRTNDFDGNPKSEIHNAYVFVQDGTHRNTGWILSYRDSSTVIIADHSVNFVQFTAEGNLDVIEGTTGNISVTTPTSSQFIVDLNKNIDIDRVTLSNSAELVFAGGHSNTNLILTAPEDASYTLTLPRQADSSGAYMRVDGSGNLYFEDISLHDISLVSNSHNLTIDVSLIDSTIKQFKLDLCDNLVLEKLTISNELIVAKDASLVFHTQTDGSSITIVAPQDASAYTLTLPETIGISGEGHKYLTTDQSGNLSFVDISNIQTDISLISKDSNKITIDPSNFGDISGFIFDLCDNLIVENLTISGGELTINHDSSLVFHTQTDGSSITIVAPHDISKSYTLTLPSDLSLGGYLKADPSGHLTFVDQKITSLNTNLIFNDPTKIINNNLSKFEQQIIYNINRQLLKEGLPIIYYLPLMTFNSDRESTIDQSFSYYDYDTKEYQVIKSSINYINERNLMHAINYNCKYMLNYASVQNILTNYIDAINGFLEIPFINIMANDFYLKVLNIATIANKYPSPTDSDDNFSSNNKNLIKFLKHLKNFKNIYDTSFNETACILPSNLNPPYYFDTSESSSIKIKYDNSWTKLSQPSLDGSYNPLLIFGDIEYEQNFVAIKNALDNNNIHANNNNGKNIIFYFYAQTVGPKENYEFDFLFADTSYNYSNLDICATPVLNWSQGIYGSSNKAFSIKNITLGSKDISDASCALFVNPNLIHLWDDKSQITDLIYFNNSQNQAHFDISNAYNNIIDDDGHDDLRLYFLVEYESNTYKVLRGTSDTSGWVYEGSEADNNGIHIKNLHEFNKTDKNGTFTINIPNLAKKSIFTQTKKNKDTKDYSLNTFIYDNSNTCFYDYGNIMFALDASLSTDLSLNNTLDKILIPPINDLNNIYDLMNDKEVYINYDTSINLHNNSYKNIDFSFDSTNKQSLTGKIYNEILDELKDPNYLKDASFSSSLEFIDCASSNLITISFDKLEHDLSNNNDSSNILIVCPLYQQNYLLNADTGTSGNFTKIKFEVDNEFSKSLYRYYPLIQYFNTLSKKQIDTCYNFTYIVSTNQTDTINDLVYSANSGTYLKKPDAEGKIYDLSFKNNLFVNHNNSKIITTYYDKLNKVYNSDKDYSFNNIISIAPQNINSYIQSSNSNLIEKILIHNYNSIENPNSSLLDDLGNTSILTNYNSIETMINTYMLYILYESSQEISNNLINIIKQEKNDNSDFKLYDFYKIMNSKKTHNDPDISLISQIIKGEIKLTENGLTKLLQDLNFSFFELTSDDFNKQSSYNTIIDNSNIGNFRLTMPLLHFNDNSNNDNFTTFSGTKTNSVPLRYTTLVNSFENNSNIIIYDLSNLDQNNDHKLSGKDRNRILTKWKHTYPEYFQYLTL